MNNPFKDNSLASGLLGFILGASSMGGFLYNSAPNGSLVDEGSSSSTKLPRLKDEGIGNKNRNFDDVYHGLENDSDGDVIVTPSGSRYHSRYGCHHIKDNYIIVKRESAEYQGLVSCSTCNP